MEIIEEGKLPKEKVYRARCGNCKSLVQAKRKELRTKFFPGLSGACPFCDKILTSWRVYHEQSTL